MREPLPNRVCYTTTAKVISDLHLGSPHCRYGLLKGFLKHISKPTTLILNGDTIDQPVDVLPPEAEEILDMIQDLPMISPLFICGNHDENCEEFHKRRLLQYRQVILAASKLLICHGDDFQLIRSHHRVFLSLFRYLHSFRLLLGARAVHVAEYAKNWSFFYRVLRNIVRENAVDYALQERVRIIACGHIHFPEDALSKGIRYINTGCWTEPEPHYLNIQDGDVELRKWQG